jgi:ubiquinone/menaquinone biosynthesis C-methylase UbiE
MNERVSTHYTGGGGLADRIADGLRNNGLNPGDLRASDLEAVDEFHFRGRAATLELMAQMNLTRDSNVLDIGSGLGGVARTIADAAGCRVTGIDLTKEFCDAATAMSRWVKLDDMTEFHQGDATNLPFPDNQFDRAVTVHVAMNIPQKNRMYDEARRVLEPGGIFAVYDILQGEGGDMLYPAPWAGEPSISHLATPDEMETLLSEAGFKIRQATDSTRASLDWLEARTGRSGRSGPLPVTIELLFGEKFPEMVRNQLLALQERRMLTFSYICEA